MPDEEQAEEKTAPPSIKPSSGDRIKFNWPLDNKCYPRVIAEKQDGNQIVAYDDGGIGITVFPDETWQFASSANLLSISTFSISLESNIPQVLASIYDFFWNRPYLRYHTQTLQGYVLFSACLIAEDDFKRTVMSISLAEVPADANIIASYTISKIKVNDDQTMKLKARIVSHGIEDSLRFLLRSAWSICPLSEFRIVAYIALLWKRQLRKIDVRAPFLQKGKADRDAFISPPTKSSDSGECP